MCGRYAQTTPMTSVADLFAVTGPVPPLAPRYNIAPTQGVAMVRLSSAGEREIAIVRWGLVPSWAKELGDRPLFNARSETAAEKPSFKAAFERRRGLVPADAFYEWPPGPGGRAAPHAVRPLAGGVFAMAGIWDVWQSPDGSEVHSVAILTTEARGALATLHHRMPVILAPDHWAGWLDGSSPLPAPVPVESLEAVRVSTRVNTAGADGPDLLDPHTPEPPAPEPQLSLF